MKKILIILSFVFILCSCQKQPLVEKEKLKIVVASDLHYFLKDYYQDCDWFEESIAYGDGKMVTYADEIMEAFIDKIQVIQPDILILTGDLSFNGEKGSHKKLAQLLSKLKEVPVAVIPGNHDVDNIYTKGYGKDDYFDVENVDAREFKNIYENFSYNLASAKHSHSLSYRIDLNEKYSLLMMDSTAHKQTGASLDVGGYFTDSTYDWLEKQLKDIKDKNKTPFIAMHHNLTHHSELLNQGYTIKNQEKIIALFKKYHVPFVLSGHIHCQNIKEIEGIYDIASSSLLDAPLQYGVIDMTNNQMSYQTQTLKITQDANYYFETVSKNRFSENFQIIKDERIREDMKAVIAKANLYYFTGNISKHIDELKKMSGYNYFFTEEGKNVSFYKKYLESMMAETKSQQSLKIKIL